MSGKTPNLSTPSSKRISSIGLAVYLGHRTIVEFQIEKGADVKFAARKTGFTALTGTVSNSHIDVAELLIAEAANVNHRCEAGFSPLMVATERGDRKMVELLLARGADMNARTDDGKTPLSIAKERKGDDVVALLRERNAPE